jgi:lipoprotein-releasing system ATP-binding protein
MILEAFDIHKIYNHSATKLEVLKGIDFQVRKGEVVAVVGPSGAGKSTLLHTLGGLDSPDTGTVLVEGQDIYMLNDDQRAKLRNQKIGFVFQFYHLLPEFTALENVLLPMAIRADSGNLKRFQAKGIALLRKMGLSERKDHKPNQLSGGEQQRVAIARAIINNPDIIFCDEPTGNLDSQSSSEIIKLLMALNREEERTLVIVTHDEEIAKLAGRIIRIKDGKLI